MTTLFGRPEPVQKKTLIQRLWCWLKSLVGLGVLLTLSLAPTLSSAQTPPAPAQAPTTLADAATRIADAAQPTKTIFDDYTSCVKDLVGLGMKVNKAADKCAQVRDREARRSEKTANEAADAEQAHRPVVVAPYYGGYGYYSYGGGYYSPRRPVIWGSGPSRPIGGGRPPVVQQGVARPLAGQPVARVNGSVPWSQ